MDDKQISRRQVIRQASRAAAGLAGIAVTSSDVLARALYSRQDEVIPFLDQPDDPPREGMGLLDWQSLDSWITPTDEFFRVGHYGQPPIDAPDWRLEIGGLVERPLVLSLEGLQRRQRAEVVFTMECAGNGGFPWFMGGIGNARWAGTPLASLLQEVGVRDDGIEVVFYGADEGDEEVRGITMQQSFARSMSLEDAMSPHNLVCWEMNGEPLPIANGFPVRLIAPGWYGVANVKWLTRIELRDTRFMGRFMARDYVTIREEVREGEGVWTESSVGRSRIKSLAAKVVRGTVAGSYRIHGAAWGAPVDRVEVRIDDGAWEEAIVERRDDDEFAWKFWHLDWTDVAPGEHAITSRAIAADGSVQPPMDDPWIANKKTYWESNGQVTRRIRI